MKKILLLLFLIPFLIQAQQSDDSLRNEQSKQIEQLVQQCNKLQQQNNDLQNRLSRLEQNTNMIVTKLSLTDSNVANVDEKYRLRLSETDEQLTLATTAVKETGARQKNSTIWGLIIAIVLAMVSAVVYFLLHKRITKKGDDIELLRVRADDLNRQMVERMDKELEELQKIVAFVSSPVTTLGSNEVEPDHSLVKALAYGITRIEFNLHGMNPDVRGYKQLQIALRKMKDNLRANNYEIVDMLGQEYNEGMTLSNVTFKEDPNMEAGKQTITRVIQPQINYHGKAIQFADIEVSKKE